MSTTLRIYYGKEKGLVGRSRMNFNWPPITRKSTVLITAAEATDLQSDSFDPQKYDLHLGDADVWVSNISPHDGGVEFILHVQWSQPLDIAVDITVIGDLSPTQFFYT